MKSQVDGRAVPSVPFWFSVRVMITFVGFLGMIVHFSQKTNISIALVCMVNHSAIELHQKSINTHPLLSSDQYCRKANKTISPGGPFLWSKNIQGVLLAAYFGGYIVTQIPAGYLAARFGARVLFAGAVLTSSLTTLLMPLAAAQHWTIFSVTQVIVGLAHGMIWPCMAVIMARWAPPHERGKLMGFMNAGAQAGNVLILSTGGIMCSWKWTGGWPLIFYSVGSLGCLWAILWVLVYRDSPRQHRCIGTIEKNFLLEQIPQQLSGKCFQTPWRAVVRSRACWALFIIHTCNNWGTYTFLTSIPKYMDEVLAFDIRSNGMLSAIPYISQWLVINLSGVTADLLIRRRMLTVTQTRKLFTSLGSLLPALLVLALAFVPCQWKYVAVALLTIGVAFSGCCFGGGFILVANDIAPAYAGIIFGVSNTFGTIPGIISPYLVGALTEASPKNWQTVFFICAGVYTVGAIVFLSIGSGELQAWAVRPAEHHILENRSLSSDRNETDPKESSTPSPQA